MINLHCHTEHSIGDAINTTMDLAEAAAGHGQSAIAITDHGNVGGFLDFILACEAKGVKPIVGMEAYLCYDLEKNKDKRKYWHCLLLAKNAEGLSNLIRLTSRSYDEGFYRKPRIMFDWLEKSSSGLICATACRGGIVCPSIDNQQLKEARDILRKFKDVFGDDFYGEIQIIEADGTNNVNKHLVDMCTQLDIPVIATADAHYRLKDQALVHDRFIKIHSPKLEYTTKRLWIKSEQDMLDDNDQYGCFARSDVLSMLDNTELLGKKITDYDLQKSDIFKMRISADDDAQFKKEVTDGWNKYKRSIPRDARQTYLSRIQSEHRVISRGGFCTYFLMVQDIVRYARKSGIAVGPGRGSAVGCLCGFLMGITKVDPIANGLIFERFLNEGRLDPKRAKIFGAALPDIDLDFSAKRRPEVKQYIFDKYPGQSTSIGTFGTIKIKTALKDVAHQRGMSFFDINLVTKHLNPDSTVEEAVKADSKFAKWYHDGNKGWVDAEVSPIIGRIRQQGIHAAGVVVSSCPIDGVLPTKTLKPRGAAADAPRMQVSQLNDKNCEKMGMVKFDILGLSTLDTIERCLQLVREKGDTVDLDNIDLEDPNVYDLYRSGLLCGIFQYDTDSGRDMIRLLKPAKFYDLVVGTALNRPAVLDLGLHKNYVSRKNGHEPVRFDHPLLKDVVNDTYGILVFQEQLISAVMSVANMSAVEADLFRVATGKKDKALMTKELEKFVAAAITNGVSEEIANRLATKFEKFAGYSFNKSHSCAYALIGYQAAWLKYRYPLEFYCALLDACDQERYNSFILEAGKQGIKVNAPKVGLSTKRFSAHNGEIYMPLSSIKGIGETLSNKIVEVDPSSLAVLFEQLPKREMNVAKFCTLVAAGSLKGMSDYGDIVELATKRYRVKKENLKERVNKFDINDILGFMVKDDSKKLRDSVPGLDKIPYLKDIDGKQQGYKCQTLGVISSVTEKTTKTNSKMAFVELRDATGSVDILFWENNLNKVRDVLVSGNLMVVTGKRGRGNSIVCDQCKVLSPNLTEVGCA